MVQHILLFRCVCSSTVHSTHSYTRAIEFLVSHYKQLFSVNNHAVVTESLCGNILHMACVSIVEGEWRRRQWQTSNGKPMYPTYRTVFAHSRCSVANSGHLIDSKNQVLLFGFGETRPLELLSMYILFGHEHGAATRLQQNAKQTKNFRHKYTHDILTTPYTYAYRVYLADTVVCVHL